MSMEENKAAIRAAFAAVDQAQSMDRMADYVTPDYISHLPGSPTMNLAGVVQFGNAFYTACPGLRHSIEDIIAEGDRVALRMRVIGTHTQPLMTPAGPLPPQGKSFELLSINFLRFENGKVAEQYAAFDMMGFMQQIGAMPAATDA